MSADSQPITPSNLVQQLPGLIVPSLASNWNAIMARLFPFIRARLAKRANRNLYEILDYDLTVDLRDKDGRLAVFRRRQKVRFLQDHVIAYQDEAWGDGEVLASYKCTPGVPVDSFQIGARRLILISLRQTKNRGDVVEFSIEREVRDGFARPEEWVEVETRYPTRRLKMAVVFPPGRPCRQARLIERRAERTTVLGRQCFRTTRTGQQMLTWETKRPVQRESYTLSWAW